MWDRDGVGSMVALGPGSTFITLRIALSGASRNAAITSIKDCREGFSHPRPA